MNQETVKAIIRIVVTAGVNIANLFGYALDADQWVNAALTIASFVTIIWSWWKNNNVTHAAQQGQRIVTFIKDVEKSPHIENGTVLAETAVELSNGYDAAGEANGN